MPFLRRGTGTDEVELYYEVRGECGDSSDDDRPMVVMIMGFACTLGGWTPQLDELLAEDRLGRPAARVLLLDNRGVGRSSIPQRRSAYSTTAMAQDALAIMDHLGWSRAHICGHSMGGMIATRLAALAPERVTTLTLISTTAGGTQSIPRSWRALKYALQLARAGSVEDRAKVDLKLHFCPATLDEPDKKYGRTRRELLHEEYVEGSKRGGIGQPRHGFMGQLRAIWMHRVTDREAAAIVRAQIPVLVLHGRHDILATPRFGEQLARRLAAPCVLLEGAHFLTRERGPEVNQLIAHVLAHGRRLHSQRHRYLDAPPPPKSPGQDSEAGSCTSPLDMARAPSPSPSPPVSRVSSSTYLLASSPL